jgi:hypothetical protein
MNKQHARHDRPVGGLVVIREWELVALGLLAAGIGLVIGMAIGLP